jgi:GNAT superfamily N-acetyltransferase
MDADTMLQLIDEDRQHIVSPNFRREEGPGVVRWCSTIEKEIKIKYATVTESDLDECVVAEIEGSRQRGCTLEWQVYEHDQPKALSHALSASGFRKGETGAFMVLDASVQLHREAPDLDVRRIREASALRDYERVLRLAWGERDFSEHRAFLETYLKRWPDYLALFVGYVEATPVSCGRVLLNPDSHFAHLAGGATVPDHRRRGYYSKLVATRLEAARLGSARFSSVTASPASEPALSKLGFRTVTKVTPWQGPEAA